jgi:hypothetical protein
MHDVLVAPRAVLLPLHALGMHPAVLRGEVVAIFAVVAGEDDLISWHLLFDVVSELAIGIEPMTSPLPRECSTD